MNGVRMTSAVLAEAGFSECARDAACAADFNRWAWTMIGIGVLGVSWVAISVAATVHIAYSQIVDESRFRWIAAVWLLPFVGPVVWWVWAIHEAWRWRGEGATDWWNRPRGS